MNNQDIQETQVRIANKSEKNPPFVSLEGHKSEERKSSAKERQESSSSLISKLHPKSKKKRRKRVVALREKSPQKLHYTQRRKRNMVKGEDEIILQLLMIHPQLMEMIQMTHNIRGLK